ncbi:hypothetical protein [Moorena sp. SIOASIH]|uniref:hypothetical protein n=1 Tax=Moorena sp. SIOASIH TaxID=2607817 RepID=UPI0025D8DD53|nr:hypothetical protein [Moorena sp. SIOASIH]
MEVSEWLHITPATDKLQPASCNLQPLTFNLQPWPKGHAIAFNQTTYPTPNAKGEQPNNLQHFRIKNVEF